MLMEVSGFDQGLSSQPAPAAEPVPHDHSGDLRRQLALFRRRLKLFLIVFATVFLLMVAAALLMTKKYTAVGEVLLDPRQQKITNDQEVLSGLLSGQTQETTAIDSEVDVMKSRNLAERVVNDLNLQNDPEFYLPKAPVFSRLVEMIPGLNNLFPPMRKRSHDGVVDEVLGGLNVTRSGLTYGIKVAFTATSGKKAALIANTFCDDYLLEQLDAKFEATKRASDWLGGRLAGLKTQVEAADGAVARYKASHGLIGIAPENGATMAQQEISSIETQLAAARAQQAEADANLSTARAQLARGSSGDDLGASLGSPVINQLRQQRAVISSQVADLQGRYGALHPDMLKAKRQLGDIDAQIQAEIKRITSNLEAQAAVASQRTSSIQSSLAGAKGSLSQNGAASVGLAELERNATALNSLYQNYLERFKQTENQQGIAQSDARTISKARAPREPSFPNLFYFSGFGVLFGLMAGIASLILAEALESGLYTSEDVETQMGLPHLGSIPIAGDKPFTAPRKGSRSRKTAPTQLVLEKPLSAFAEAFRNLRTSILSSRMGEPVQVVAVTSSLPSEGKTTTCICLGRVIAMGGLKTVVVDCDLRRRSMNSMFTEGPSIGLIEVLSGSARLDDALIYDGPSGAAFLPLAQARFTPRDVFASAAMDRLLVDLRARFEVVILDTAPVLPVADTRILAPKADVTVFLAQWKRTPKKAIQAAIKQLESVGVNVVGLALTQVDMKEQVRSGYGDAGYYSKHYSEYYAS